MVVLALLLALGGGIALAVSSVAAVPSYMVVVALVAWLASLVLVVFDAASRARRDDTTVRSAAGVGAREAGRWLRDFMP